MSAGPAVRCEAVVDLAAIGHNLQAIRTRLRPGVRTMAVVKADGYGHGAVPVARTVLDAGADLIGVATPTEAVELRAAGIAGRIACWLWVPGEHQLPAAVQAGVEIAVSSRAHLAAVLAAAPGAAPAVHLKLDTGLGRNGVGPAELDDLAADLAAASTAGRIQVVGLMSHLASADVPGDESIRQQQQTFDLACARLAELGVSADRHLANTAAALSEPELQYEMVRIGIGLYGFDPLGGVLPSAAAPVPALRPAMTVRSTIALTKRVPAGHGVSYGLTYRTRARTTLALVPMGYADGIPRAASSRAEVLVRGRRRAIAGRVAMDQFVVDCGDDEVAIGDEVLVFGPGDAGEPTATDWANACDTIDYEIVTRMGPRTPRRYCGGRPGEPSAGTGGPA